MTKRPDANDIARAGGPDALRTALDHARAEAVEPNGGDGERHDQTASDEPASLWTHRLIRARSDEPRPALANVLIALRGAPEWQDVVAYDEFAQRVILQGEPPWRSAATKQGTPWNDAYDVLATDWLQHHGILIKPETTFQAVNTVAREHSVHPVRNYLKALAWDGKPRIERWLQTYIGATVTNHSDGGSEYLAAVGSRFLISAVARVEVPGAKVDHCPIFEGKQGIGKSTALRTLFWPWFSDELSEFGTKDCAMQLGGVWCVEISELDGMSRAEKERLKAFMTRTADRYRPPYGRRVMDFPRQCVFAGTTNATEYLKDETGARRFWPVACHAIDIDALTRDRDQLWAEAVVLYRAGKCWWLDNERLTEVAGAEQAARYAADVWDEPVMSYANGRVCGSVTVSEILERALGIEAGRQTQVDQNRVARTLIENGWKKRQVRIGKDRERRYFGPTVLSPLTGDNP